jgi:hypothetical protein
VLRTAWAKKQEDISKNREKSARGMAQVTEHLPSKCKKLNSSPSTANPSPTKTKSTVQRHIEISLFLICTVKQFIKRVNITECVLPEK